MNVLLITIDTLRADHLSCYGYHKHTSPNIDSIAKTGVLFLNTIAQRGQTWPSLTSILTSLYPQTHGVRENGDQLEASKITIAEILQKNGFKTGAVLTNMLNAPNRGFDSKMLMSDTLRFRMSEIDTNATQTGIQWLKENGSKAFFLWVHYLAPHRPYMPPDRYASKFAGSADAAALDTLLKSVMLRKTRVDPDVLNDVIGLYDGEVAYVDDEVGKLVRELDSLGLSENTIVVITADHGEELYDRNFHFGHGCSIYDSVLHIPLIVRLPGAIPENKKIPAVVQSIDIAPTILDLLKVKAPPQFEGKSLMNLIRNGMDGHRKQIAYSEIQDKIVSVRTNQWRYIYNPKNFHPSMVYPVHRRDRELNQYFIDTEELYFLPEDPLEKTNVIDKDRKIADQMKNAASAFRQKSKGSYQPQEMDQKTQEELRALGYIQ